MSRDIMNINIEKGITTLLDFYVSRAYKPRKNEEGRKGVLSITIVENESAKFWLSVLNGLKNCCVQDIFVICADGLSGIKEAIMAAYPLA